MRCDNRLVLACECGNNDLYFSVVTGFNDLSNSHEKGKMAWPFTEMENGGLNAC